ncbi:MAG: hypothetical protein J2P48_19050, partial [Alphaproteobacteria bacterium]|nr:hypothetical protein [Alphaproteobacteria bacterium]
MLADPVRPSTVRWRRAFDPRGLRARPVRAWRLTVMLHKTLPAEQSSTSSPLHASQFGDSRAGTSGGLACHLRAEAGI